MCECSHVAQYIKTDSLVSIMNRLCSIAGLFNSPLVIRIRPLNGPAVNLLVIIRDRIDEIKQPVRMTEDLFVREAPDGKAELTDKLVAPPVPGGLEPMNATVEFYREHFTGEHEVSDIKADLDLSPKREIVMVY